MRNHFSESMKAGWRFLLLIVTSILVFVWCLQGLVSVDSEIQVIAQDEYLLRVLTMGAGIMMGVVCMVYFVIEMALLAFVVLGESNV